MAFNAPSSLCVAVVPEAARLSTRALGAVEQNWVNAVAGGTGISVVLILIKDSIHLEPWQVGRAARKLQEGHPSLRSYIVVSKHGKPRLETPSSPHKVVTALDADPNSSGDSSISSSVSVLNEGPMGQRGKPAEVATASQQKLAGAFGRQRSEHLEDTTEGKKRGEPADWERLLEKELNTPISGVPNSELLQRSIKAKEDETYLPVLSVAVHFLSGGRRAIALRTHTAACDYSAVA
jgi:hypothetical protein